MSALPPKADIDHHGRDVRFVPIADIMLLHWQARLRRQDRQDGNFGADPLGQGDAVLDSFPGEFRPVCGIRIWVYIAFP